MPAALSLDLTDAERRPLHDARKRHDKPYVRERAAALLKIDDGWSGRKVAREGLLQSRVPDTVYTWYHDWQDHGIAALYIEDGRVHDSCRETECFQSATEYSPGWP